MSGLTPKQENFCQIYIETGNASEGYRQSYNAAKMKPESINRKAKELLDNVKIAARIDALRAAQVSEHLDTVESIARMLHDDRAYARQCGTPAAAVTATMGLAKLRGHLTNKVVVKDDRAIAAEPELSDDEAANMLADRIMKEFAKRQAERARSLPAPSN